jgi:cell division protein FtsB
MDHVFGSPLVRPLSRRRQTFRLGPVVVFVMIVALVDALFGEHGLSQTIRARREYGQAAAALAVLKQENAGLREEARRLAEDPAAIELIAREEMGLIRPGEVLFRLAPVRQGD